MKAQGALEMRDSKGRFVQGHSINIFRDRISRTWFKKGNKINLGRKRLDMIGNNFNPDKIKNLRDLWGNVNHLKKSVQAQKIGSDELKLIGFFREHRIPFKFIGNSGFHIDTFFPDFIHEKGKVLLDFIAGTNKEIKKREKSYINHGYKAIFLRTNLVRRNEWNRILKIMEVCEV